MRTDTPAFAALLALELTPEQRPALESALLQGFGPARQDDIAALLDLILLQDFGAARRVRAEGVDRLFLDALVDVVAECPLQAGWAQPCHAVRLHEADIRWDFFFSLCNEMAWSLERCVNFLYRARIKPARRIAIVTAARNEGINIIEWIAHHWLLGIDDFFIYVNDNDDGSSELLRILAEHGVIHLIHNATTLGKDGGDMFPIQARVYGHATQVLKETRGFAWLLFSDIDEFLVTQPLLEAPETTRPLDDLFRLVDAMPGPPAAVALHWKWFNSQCEFRRRPGLNFERFPFWIGTDHVKTIVRGSRPLSFSTSHMPRLPHGDVVLNGALQPLAAPNFRMWPAAYDYAQVNHYWNKSFEEFIAKHLRVWGDRTFDTFFDYGANRVAGGTREAMPEAWMNRLRQEIASLTALPGVAATLAEIETNFAAMLAEFDRQHDNEALFYRHFARLKPG